MKILSITVADGTFSSHNSKFNWKNVYSQDELEKAFRRKWKYIFDDGESYYYRTHIFGKKEPISYIAEWYWEQADFRLDDYIRSLVIASEEKHYKNIKISYTKEYDILVELEGKGKILLKKNNYLGEVDYEISGEMKTPKEYDTMESYLERVIQENESN